MRPLNVQLMNALDASEDQESDPLSTVNVLHISAQAVVTDSSTGTLKLQFSNDNVFSPYTPTSWSDITDATVDVAGAGVYAIEKTDLCYTWIKAVFTKDGGEDGTITVNAKTIGA